MLFTSSGSLTVSNHHVGAYVRNVGPSIHPVRVAFNMVEVKVASSVHSKKKLVIMIKIYHNHTLRTNLWQRKEEAQRKLTVPTHQEDN